MKVISYTLTPEGRIPDYVLDGGYFAIPNEKPAPQDWNLLGIATDEAPEAEITDLTGYFDSIDYPVWTKPNGEDATPAEILALLEDKKTVGE